MNLAITQIWQRISTINHQFVVQVCGAAINTLFRLFGEIMSSKIRIFRVFGSLLLILAVSMLAFADTIRLKDGSILKGKITGFASGNFTIAIGEGSRSRQMTFSASEIESIAFDSPMSAPPQTGEAINRNASYKPPLDSPRVVVSDNSRTIMSPPKRKADLKIPNAKPIEVNVKVLADNTSNGWTNSGWVVKKGQVIRISGDGKISLGNGESAPSSGLSNLDDSNKLLKNVPTGALIAVIGDDNNEFIYIGAEREFTATRDGSLFLGINEGNLDDNSGAFNVKIEIAPDSGN